MHLAAAPLPDPSPSLVTDDKRQCPSSQGQRGAGSLRRGECPQHLPSNAVYKLHFFRRYIPLGRGSLFSVRISWSFLTQNSMNTLIYIKTMCICPYVACIFCTHHLVVCQIFPNSQHLPSAQQPPEYTLRASHGSSPMSRQRFPHEPPPPHRGVNHSGGRAVIMPRETASCSGEACTIPSPATHRSR